MTILRQGGDKTLPNSKIYFVNNLGKCVVIMQDRIRSFHVN